ncbi:DUF2497 domain-containing protein [Kiloniella laminariae]|uniref:DUF2497 domain-containing protein n=1 Tax=Kiloniella laminariae TaxID=454162 RepID=A0ABT4LNJ3_9PROT|nr:DUF2497 domain-containing protein [Kiloniella laminariae]MCZ4282644.1 DUF2497 domain-containing protein [Kiloniella laminariae]
MSNQETQGEPSMEEILASIRRIISEDGPEGEDAPKAAVAAEEESEAEAEDDILDLTEEVVEEEEVLAADEADEPEEETAEEPVPEEDSIEEDFRNTFENPEPEEEIEEEDPFEAVEEDLSLEEESQPEAEPEPEEDLSFEEEAPVEESVEVDFDEEGDDLDLDLDVSDAVSILQEETQDKAASALSEIARAAVVQRSLAIGTGKTLEDIVREALVPELKAWLDVRLGPMVERIVREEIKKMVRRAEDL